MTLSTVNRRCRHLEDHVVSECVVCENVKQEMTTFASSRAASADKEMESLWKLCSFQVANSECFNFRDMATFLGYDAEAKESSEPFQALMAQLAGKDYYDKEDLLKATLRDCTPNDWKGVLADVVLAVDSIVSEAEAMRSECEAFLFDAVEDLAGRLESAQQYGSAAFCYVLSCLYPTALKCLKKQRRGTSEGIDLELIEFETFLYASDSDCRFDDESLPRLAARLIGMGQTGLATEIIRMYAPASEQLVVDAFSGMYGENKELSHSVDLACSLLRLGKMKPSVSDALTEICHAVIESDYKTALGVCSKIEEVAGGFVDDASLLPITELFDPLTEALQAEL